MAKKTTDITIDMLETPPLSTEETSVDLSILQKATEYGVDIHSLEDAFAPQSTPITPEQTKPEEKEKKYWQDLDVNLKDVVNLLMNSSERPIIMVCDDKIIYLNYAAMQTLDIKEAKTVIDEPFLSLVVKDDWEKLTSNIGEMLTSASKQQIKLRSPKGKIIPIDFHAIYLPDSNHFSFILVGNHQNKPTKPFFNNLYDDLTGLPNFFLFEDRVQMAVNNENYKDSRLPKDLIAVIGINIDNVENFRKLRLEDFMLKKLSNTLVMSLKKNYTIARGLKYPFWILMPDITNGYDLEIEIKKIMELFKEGIRDNFTTHELLVSVGVSIFPTPARSAKKLIEQSISAIKEAQNNPSSSFVVYHQSTP